MSSSPARVSFTPDIFRPQCSRLFIKGNIVRSGGYHSGRV